MPAQATSTGQEYDSSVMNMDISIKRELAATTPQAPYREVGVSPIGSNLSPLFDVNVHKAPSFQQGIPTSPTKQFNQLKSKSQSENDNVLSTKR